MFFNTIITLKIWIKHDLYIAREISKKISYKSHQCRKQKTKTKNELTAVYYNHMKLWTHLTSSISVHNPALGKLSVFLALVQLLTSVLSMSDDSALINIFQLLYIPLLLSIFPFTWEDFLIHPGGQPNSPVPNLSVESLIRVVVMSLGSSSISR